MSASSQGKGPVAACPQCKQPAALNRDNPFRPFCCERCRDIDLAGWLGEDYRIPGRPADPWELPAGDQGDGGRER